MLGGRKELEADIIVGGSSKDSPISFPRLLVSESNSRNSVCRKKMIVDKKEETIKSKQKVNGSCKSKTNFDSTNFIAHLPTAS